MPTGGGTVGAGGCCAGRLRAGLSPGRAAGPSGCAQSGSGSPKVQGGQSEGPSGGPAITPVSRLGEVPEPWGRRL